MRKEVEEFAQAMEANMARHGETKGDSWKNGHWNLLWDTLHLAYGQLCVDAKAGNDDSFDFDTFSDQCVDLANMCMIMRYSTEECKTAYILSLGEQNQ